MSEHYEATGVCRGCYYSLDCHEPRQHAVDMQRLGDCRDCEFFKEHERRRVKLCEQITQELLREAGALRRPE